MYIVQYGNYYEGTAKLFDYKRDAVKFLKKMHAKGIWAKMVAV